MVACIPPRGHVADGTDCDDADGNDFPGNEEVCDGADNDCDEQIDEELEGCDPGTSTGGADTGDDTSTTAPADSSGDATASDPSASATDPDDGSGEDESDSSGGETAGQTDDGGCGCNTDRSANAAWWLAALVVPVLRRRRAR